MYLSQNLQYLRKSAGNMTQEKLAERLGVSRQTVSKWESGENLPDLSNLIELCDLFSCSLDDLLRRDLTARNSIYTSVRFEKVKGFRYASHVVISRDPEADAFRAAADWAEKAGFSRQPVYIGWDFPHISQEQKHRFHLRGYTAAVILPQDFETDVPGMDFSRQNDGEYAVMTIRDPFADPFDRIPGAYRLILEYLRTNNIRKQYSPDYLPCFEREYIRDGVSYMDIYINCQGIPRCDAITEFI